MHLATYTSNDITDIMVLKPTTFHGDSLNRIRDFPDDVRRQVGH